MEHLIKFNENKDNLLYREISSEESHEWVTNLEPHINSINEKISKYETEVINKLCKEEGYKYDEEIQISSHPSSNLYYKRENSEVTIYKYIDEYFKVNFKTEEFHHGRWGVYRIRYLCDGLDGIIQLFNDRNKKILKESKSDWMHLKINSHEFYNFVENHKKEKISTVEHRQIDDLIRNKIITPHPDNLHTHDVTRRLEPQNSNTTYTIGNFGIIFISKYEDNWFVIKFQDRNNQLSFYLCDGIEGIYDIFKSNESSDNTKFDDTELENLQDIFQEYEDKWKNKITIRWRNISSFRGSILLDFQFDKHLSKNEHKELNSDLLRYALRIESFGYYMSYKRNHYLGSNFNIEIEKSKYQKDRINESKENLIQIINQNGNSDKLTDWIDNHNPENINDDDRKVILDLFEYFNLRLRHVEEKSVLYGGGHTGNFKLRHIVIKKYQDDWFVADVTTRKNNDWTSFLIDSIDGFEELKLKIEELINDI